MCVHLYNIHTRKKYALVVIAAPYSNIEYQTLRCSYAWWFSSSGCCTSRWSLDFRISWSRKHSLWKEWKPIEDRLSGEVAHASHSSRVRISGVEIRSISSHKTVLWTIFYVLSKIIFIMEGVHEYFKMVQFKWMIYPLFGFIHTLFASRSSTTCRSTSSIPLLALPLELLQLFN